MSFKINPNGSDDEDSFHYTNGSSKIPFSTRSDSDEEALIVHVKVLTTEQREIEAAAIEIQKAVKGHRVNGKPICVIVTDESVSMSLGMVRSIASYVTPEVKNALGIP